MRPFRPADISKSLLASADAVYVGEGANRVRKAKRLGSGNGRLYVNSSSQEFLNELLEAATGIAMSRWEGVTFSPNAAQVLRRSLNAAKVDNSYSSAERRAIARLAKQFSLANRDEYVTVVVQAGPERTSIADVKGTVRQELLHRAQYRLLGPRSLTVHLPAERFFEQPDTKAARSDMEQKGIYVSASLEVKALEISAWVGAGQYEQLGLSRRQALNVLRHYFDLLTEAHGEKVNEILRLIVPDLRKELVQYAADKRNGKTSGSTSPSGPE